MTSNSEIIISDIEVIAIMAKGFNQNTRTKLNKKPPAISPMLSVR